MRRSILLGCGALFVIAAISLLWALVAKEEEAKRETVALGARVYALNCAGCHGASLEGQPNWQTPLPSGKLPAPPLNATGHGRHHSETELLRIVKKGMTAVSGKPSDMPAFETTLSNVEIEAVIAYVKSTW